MSRDTVRAFWWRPTSRTVRQKGLDLVQLWTRPDPGSPAHHLLRPPWRLRNFGDELTPRILTDLDPGTDVTYSSVERAEAVLVGSIIQRVLISGAKGCVVLGAGMPGELSTDLLHRMRAKRDKADIRFVRGPLTRAHLGLPRETPVADAALALTKPPASERSERGLIVAHFGGARSRPEQAATMAIATRLQADVIYSSAPVDVLLPAIATARFVLSTSLHGVIISDLFETPTAAVTLKPASQRDFRFQDYGESVERAENLRLPLLSMRPPDVDQLTATKTVDPGRVAALAAEARSAVAAWLASR